MGVNTYYSQKRNRKYVRSFDYFEAQVRFARGEPASKLASDYGVSVSRIYQVASPAYRKSHNAYQESLKTKGRCNRCKKPTNQVSQRLGAKLCNRCAADDRITTVRPKELSCGHCKRWLPDEEFGIYKTAPAHRRGRYIRCRECVAKKRRDQRHRAFKEGRARNLS